jgi:hypothetical protein
MRRSVTVLVSVVALFLFAAGSAPAADKTIASYQCFAANMQRGRTNVININIDRWSTDEEREALLTTLQEFGQDKLLDALMKIRPPVGYMRTPNSIGYDLYYARKKDLPEGGQHVVIATNRRVAFGEAASNTRSMQYQFTLIEIHIDKDGKGEGKMVPAAKVSWDKDAKKLEIENYSALPIDLINVKETTKKPK